MGFLTPPSTLIVSFIKDLGGGGVGISVLQVEKVNHGDMTVTYPGGCVLASCLNPMMIR